MGMVGQQEWLLGWALLPQQWLPLPICRSPQAAASFPRPWYRQSCKTKMLLLWQSGFLLYTAVLLRQRKPLHITHIPGYHKRELD